MTTRRFTTALLAAACLGVATTSHAVTPASFTHTTEADFADGDAYGTVVTNLGDIKLASDTTPLEGLPEDVSVIHDVAKLSNGVVYVSTGPQARIYEIKGDAVELVIEFPGEQAFAMYTLGARLVIGVSSFDSSRLIELKDGKPETLAELPESGYIWDIAEDDRGTKSPEDDVYVLATGSPGRLYTVPKSGGNADLLYESSQSNLLTVATRHQRAPFYVGTDTDGLVYRVERDGSPFVLFDAPEAEVAALSVTGDGTVYAGTAAVDQAKPGRLEQPTKAEEGRPEVAELDLGPKPEELTQPGGDQATSGAPDTPEARDAAAEPGGEAAGTDPQNADLGDTQHAAGKPAKPTPEQYDELRETLREKLQTARETGQFDAPAGVSNAVNKAPNRPSRAKPAAPGPKKKGNAIYRIAPDGFVTEVFRESAMILAIAAQDDGKLIVATGNEGQVYAVNPALKEAAVLADFDSTQVTCAVQTEQGLLLGAANPAALMRMDAAIAEQGGYTSQVLDAKQVSMFGVFKLTADVPANTSVSVELRTGNVGDPELAAWSKWSKAVLIEHDESANPLQPRELKIEVPPARYLQYRLTLTGNGEQSPVIDQADLAYVAPNTSPTVSKLVLKPAEVKEPGTGPDPKVLIQWQATDQNQDRLVYSLEYKPGKSDRYLPLAEELTETKYPWQTQHVPDGWYTLRVTAHDKLDNPADSAKSGGRVSEPLLIDNTDPVLEGLKAEVLGDGKVRLTAKANDELSAIASVAYSIDGSDTYQASLPNDLIYDSTSEPWGVTILDLSPGEHVIAVRAIDARGNTAYRQLIVTVE